MKTTPILLPLLLSLSCAGLAQTVSPEAVETFATLQTDTGNTEAICEAPDGTLYVTNLPDSIIWSISPNGQVEQFAALDKDGIVGCAAYGDGLIVTALSKPYMRAGGGEDGGPSLDLSDVGPEVLILNGSGAIVGLVRGQPGQLFAAVAALGEEQYLVSDATGGALWLFEPRAERLALWLQDDRFAPEVGGPPIGMEGIGARDGVVVAGNASKRALYRIDVGADGLPQGEPVQLMQGDFGPNDFDVGPGGVAYVPSGTSVFRVTPAGEVSLFAADVPSGGAALVSRDGEWLYWPTRGGAGAQPGTEYLLRVPLE